MKLLSLTRFTKKSKLYSNLNKPTDFFHAILVILCFLENVSNNLQTLFFCNVQKKLHIAQSSNSPPPHILALSSQLAP